ncbi:MAG TPA: metallophosphoesterase family protein [Terriglobia bacterium]|nr:metallophosphoesterase family protein [Terriglobia bacterium]
MKIGIVSDTHGYFDPRLPELLAGSETILHAGDAGGHDVLDDLALIAPVRAVRGNVDPPASDLPLSLRLDLAGVPVEMLHILPEPQAQLAKWSGPEQRQQSGARNRFLGQFQPSTRVVIFGHSHEPCLCPLDGKLFLNPGSAGKKRFSLPRCCGLMTVSGEELEVKILSLEDYNEKVLQSIRFGLGGSAQ